MTIHEFQDKYYRYVAKTREEALAEIAKIPPVFNKHGETVEIVPVDFGDLGWGLMTKTAASNLREWGIV